MSLFCKTLSTNKQRDRFLALIVMTLLRLLVKIVINSWNTMGCRNELHLWNAYEPLQNCPSPRTGEVRAPCKTYIIFALNIPLSGDRREERGFTHGWWVTHFWHWFTRFRMGSPF